MKIIDETKQKKEAGLLASSDVVCNTCKHANATNHGRYINCDKHKCSFGVLSWCINWELKQ